MTQILSPVNNVNTFSYKPTKLFRGTPGNKSGDVLAAPTNTAAFPLGYQAGQILARYTSGANLGLLVNWDALGTDGQAVPVSILVDEGLQLTGAVAPTGLVSIAMLGASQGGWLFNNTALYGSIAGAGRDADVAAAMALFGAKAQIYNNELFWYWG
jgi:hypothetical protein